jgi:hypothetical protein
VTGQDAVGGYELIDAVWTELETGTEVPRDRLRAAVKAALSELSRRAPGRSVEVRIPPLAAAQVVAGSTHRRGTPPAVVEADPRTWLALVLGHRGWAEAVATGAVHASGARSDLSEYLPLWGADSRI